MTLTSFVAKIMSASITTTDHKARPAVPPVPAAASASALPPSRDGETEGYSNEVSGYTHEDRVFIDAVISGDSSEIRSPYSDALKTLQVTLAASQSFETKQPVFLS